jgi:hypothetical protein
MCGADPQAWMRPRIHVIQAARARAPRTSGAMTVEAQPVKPGCGSPRKHCRDRQAALNRNQDLRGPVRQACPHVSAGSEPSPTTALELPSREACLARLFECERAAGQLNGNNRTSWHGREIGRRKQNAQECLLSGSRTLTWEAAVTWMRPEMPASAAPRYVGTPADARFGARPWRCPGLRVALS